MAALTTGLPQHRDYAGSVEQASGLAPEEDQVFTAAEINALINAIDDHGPLIDTIKDIADGLPTFDDNAVDPGSYWSAAKTISEIAVVADALAAVTLADDDGYDTLQEIIDKLKAAETAIANITSELGATDTDYINDFYQPARLFAITGSVSSASAYVLGVTTNAATEGASPYSYTITLDFLSQSARQVVISGDDLGAVPLSITDTASKITLGGTGAIICDDATTINDLVVANGSTQNVFNGVLGDFEIVSNLADLYGNIDISISAEDSRATTVTVTL